MARDEAPPFGRGETYGATSATDGAHLLGNEYVFEDLDYSTSPPTVRSAKKVRCRLVRNTAAAALLPKRIGRFSTTGGEYGQNVDGYTAVTAQQGFPIDEFLPAAGVAVNDIFYVVVEGPAKILTDIAAVDTISVGDPIVALTAATSGATTAGRADKADFASANSTGTAIADQIRNQIGRALSAKTSANTNSDLLVEVGKW